MSAPGGIGYGPLRHAANGFAPCVAGHADEALGLGVVRLHLVVVDRPVDDVGAVDRAELATRLEVDLAEARELAVGVEAAAADGRRQVVDLAREQMRSPSASSRRYVRGSSNGSGPRKWRRTNLISSFETWPSGLERRLEREQVVAALLEHDHRPARAGQHVGRGRARRPGADDDGVAVAAQARPLTSSSV